MKKFTFLLLMVGFTSVSNAQTSWSTNLNGGTGGLKLGTIGPQPLDFYTNSTKNMTLDDHGNLNLKSLAGPGIRYVVVDDNGNFKVIGPGSPPNGSLPQPVAGSCEQSAMSWFTGGNYYPPNGGTIGTCNVQDFILKSNNLNSIYIKPNGLVGIGPNNSGPAGNLDISAGTTGAYGGIARLKFNFDAVTSSFNGVTTTDAFNAQIESTTGMMLNYATNGVFSINQGPVATSNERLNILGNTMTVKSFLDVENYNIRSKSTTNSIAKITVQNTQGGCDFIIDGNGKGRITHGTWNNLNYLSFGMNPWGGSWGGQQVWVGNYAPMAPHSDFAFAVAGKLLAQSIYVTPSSQWQWADYVFADDYKLPQLSDVEKFYKKNKHLPEIPTTKDVEERGIDVGIMNTLLLKKVEELTLYLVEQQKKTQELSNEIEKLKKNK